MTSYTRYFLKTAIISHRASTRLPILLNMAYALFFEDRDYQPQSLNKTAVFIKHGVCSWHYLWDPYRGFGHDGSRIQSALPSLPSAIVKVFGLLGLFFNFQTISRYVNVPGLFGQPSISNILSWHYLWDPYGGFGHDGSRIQPALPSLPSAIVKVFGLLGLFSTFHTFKINKCSWIVWPS